MPLFTSKSRSSLKVAPEPVQPQPWAAAAAAAASSVLPASLASSTTTSTLLVTCVLGLLLLLFSAASRRGAGARRVPRAGRRASSHSPERQERRHSMSALTVAGGGDRGAMLGVAPGLPAYDDLALKSRTLRDVLARRSRALTVKFRRTFVYKSVHALRLAPGGGDGLTSIYSVADGDGSGGGATVATAGVNDTRSNSGAGSDSDGSGGGAGGGMVAGAPGLLTAARRSVSGGDASLGGGGGGANVGGMGGGGGGASAAAWRSAAWRRSSVTSGDAGRGSLTAAAGGGGDDERVALSPPGLLMLQSLLALEVFDGMQESVLLRVCRGAEFVSLPPGVPLITQGAPLDEICVLDQGTLDVSYAPAPEPHAVAAAAAAAAATGGDGAVRVSGGGGRAAATAATAAAAAAAVPALSVLSTDEHGMVLLGLSDLLGLLLPPRARASRGLGAAHRASVTVTTQTVVRVARIPRAREALAAALEAANAAAAAGRRSHGSGGSSGCGGGGGATSAALMRSVLARLHLVTMHCACLYLGLVNELRPGGGASPPLPPAITALADGAASTADAAVSAVADAPPPPRSPGVGAGAGAGQPPLAPKAEASPPPDEYVRAVVALALGVEPAALPPVRRAAAAAAADSLAAAVAAVAVGGSGVSGSAAPSRRGSADGSGGGGAELELLPVRVGEPLPLSDSGDGAAEDEGGPCMYVVVAGACESRVAQRGEGAILLCSAMSGSGGGGGGAEGGAAATAPYFMHTPGSPIGLLCMMTGSTAEWYARRGRNATGIGRGAGGAGTTAGGGGAIRSGSMSNLLSATGGAGGGSAGAGGGGRASGGGGSASTLEPVLTVRGSAAGCAAAGGGTGGGESTFSPAGHSSRGGEGGEVAAWVVRLRRGAFDALLRRRTRDVVARACAGMIANMDPLLRSFDFTASYSTLDAGQVLVKCGQPADSLYVVLHGRLRALPPPSRARRASDPSAMTAAAAAGVVGGVGGDVITYSRGALIGEAALMADAPHARDVVAARPACVARIPARVLALLGSRYPRVVARLAAHAAAGGGAGRGGGAAAPFASGGGAAGVRSLAVVPASAGAPLEALALRLAGAMAALGLSVRLLTGASVAARLGLEAQDLDSYDMGSFVAAAVSSHLAMEEESADVVLLQADWHASTWTQLCCQHADGVLLVASASDPPALSQLERELGLPSAAGGVESTLALVHLDPPKDYRPRHTRRWFAGRALARHYHIRLHLQGADAECPPRRWSVRSDVMRVARCLTGRGVGLALGGGGARGMAHVGLVRALEEQHIPVDMVAGTSFGALVGGLYAANDSLLGVLPPVTRFAKSCASVWSYVRDITLPVTSYFSGFSFNHATQLAFGESTRIEDLWLPYRCVTTDLTESRVAVHANGTAWRYVRASMSLAGYLPPICDLDTATGVLHLLIDGGYCNNLPSDIVRAMGAGTVIACDVGSRTNFESVNYGDVLGGLRMFLSRFSPFSKPVMIPSMTTISEQLAYISCVQQLEQAKAACDLYVRPPIDAYSTLEFQKAREIREVGYEHASKALARWRERSGDNNWAPRRPSLAHRVMSRSPLGSSAVASPAGTAAIGASGRGSGGYGGDGDAEVSLRAARSKSYTASP